MKRAQDPKSEPDREPRRVFRLDVQAGGLFCGVQRKRALTEVVVVPPEPPSVLVGLLLPTLT
jgi:hypothetical protein